MTERDVHEQHQTAPKGSKPPQARGRAVSRDVEKGRPSKGSAARATPRTPIDRGWAWAVLAAATLEMMIAIGFIKCTGVFYVQFQRHFDVSVSAVSVLTTIQNLTCSISSLITMTVGLRLMSCRTAVLIGSAILGLCYIVSSVAEDIGLLYFSHGFLFGVGFSFIQPPVMACLGSYFNRRRGMANNLAQIGAGVGGLVFNPLVTWLFDLYGYSGTMLITAGLHLNIIVAGALMRPLEFYTEVKLPAKRKSVIRKTSATKTPEIHKSKPIPISGRRPRTERVGSGTFLKGLGPLNLQMVTGEDEPDEMTKFVPEVSPLALDENIKGKHTFWTFSKSTPSSSEESVSEDAAAKKRFIRMQGLQRSISHDPSDMGEHRSQYVARYRTSSMSNKRPTSSVFIETNKRSSAKDGRHHVPAFASYEIVNASLMDLSSKSQSEAKPGTAFVCTPIDKTIFSRLMSAIFDVTLMKNPLFIVFLLSTCLLCAGCTSVVVFIAPHAKDLGVDDDRIGYMMSWISAVDLVARVIFGFISDSKRIRRSTLMAGSCGAIGVTCFLLSFFTSFTTLIIFAVILGLFQGVYFSLFAVIIVDYLTVENLKPSLGFTTLFQCVGTAIIFPLLAALRDHSGNYTVTYYVIGSVLLLGSGLTMMLPLIERRRKETEDEST